MPKRHARLAMSPAQVDISAVESAEEVFDTERPVLELHPNFIEFFKAFADFIDSGYHAFSRLEGILIAAECLGDFKHLLTIQKLGIVLDNILGNALN